MNQTLRSLKMRFSTESSKGRTISVRHCAESVQPADVKAFSKELIDKKVIKLKDNDHLAKLNSASIVSVTETPVDLEEEEDI